MLLLVKNGEENLVAGFSKRTRFCFSYGLQWILKVEVQIGSTLVVECDIWIQNVDIHLLVAIFSSQLDTSQKSTPSSFFIIIYAANFVRLFIFCVRIPPAVHGGESFCVGISLRLFFLTLYLSTKELSPRVSIIFAKFLEFSRVEVLKGSTGKVFRLEANCLLMVVVQLMEHEWRPTKLQQNLKWQLHTLSAQQCNPATPKVNDHVTSDMVPSNLKQHLKRQLHVVPFQNYPSAPDTGNGREILQENLLTTSKILKTAYTKHYSAEAIAWGSCSHDILVLLSAVVEGISTNSRLHPVGVFSGVTVSSIHTPGDSKLLCAHVASLIVAVN
ncbi:hypothetical protein C5167_015958 [Papaver somniferum]|nr:hypothetical protein C5167_015958 [Papaver somniferum]